MKTSPRSRPKISDESRIADYLEQAEIHIRSVSAGKVDPSLFYSCTENAISFLESARKLMINIEDGGA
jgi:hypothetical protein